MDLPPYVPRTRRIRFQGGPAHGLGWEGEIEVGRRIAGNPGPWSPDGVYVVTDRTAVSADGATENLAVPVRPGGHDPASTPGPTAP